MNKLYFLHGMESSPLGTKSIFLKKHFPECLSPELTPDIQKRKEVLSNLIKEPAYLVGSSLGGLSALLFAMEYPDLVEAMILLAPAVGAYNIDLFDKNDLGEIKKTYIPEGIPSLVIVGELDEVIPMDAIEEMIERSPDSKNILMKKVQDDHSLNNHLDLLLNSTKKMVAGHLI